MATDEAAAIEFLNELLDVSTERRLMLAYEVLLRRRQVELFVALREPKTVVPYPQIARAAGVDPKTVQRAIESALDASTLTDAVDRFVTLSKMDAGALRVAVQKARAGHPTPARMRPSPVDWPKIDDTADDESLRAGGRRDAF